MGIVLGLLVVRQSLVEHLAQVAPEVGVLLNGSHAGALTAAAEQRLEQALSQARAGLLLEERDRLPRFANQGLVGELDPREGQELASEVVLDAKVAQDIVDLLERALARSPLNARAHALLGRVAHATKNIEGARAHFRTAVAQSRHETGAVAWLLTDAWQRRADAEVLTFADILLRSRPTTLGALVPLLAKIAETEDGRADLERRLQKSPSWRSNFLRNLPTFVTDPRTPLLLMMALKTARPPVSSDELAPYLEVLLRNNLVELAYSSWLQFLSDDELGNLGRMTNGSFETKPSGLPFDWTIRVGNNAIAEIQPLPRTPEARGLHVEFSGERATFSAAVQQWLSLPAGTYRFSGSVEGELTGRRGLRWRILCSGMPPSKIAETDMIIGKLAAGRTFEVHFSVPVEDCRGQILRLEHDARSASEQIILGSVWFDELAITRRTDADPPRTPTPSGASPTSGAGAGEGRGAASAATSGR